MIRVEEELKSQRELLLTHVQVSERRFDDVNRRFDDVNKRFDDVNEQAPLRRRVNKRFDDEQALRRCKRFEDVNKRFDDNSRRHTATQWAVGVGFVVLTTLITLYQFLG